MKPQIRAEALAGLAVEIRRSRHPLEVRDQGEALELVGYAATFDDPYPIEDAAGGYSETFARGAFTKTLAQQDDIRLLVNHEGLPLARTRSGTLKLAEDHVGLRVEASLDPADPDVQRIVPKLRRGDLSEMSIAFKAIRQEWSADYSERTIREVRLYDTSLVTFPANPNTIAALRALAGADERALAEVRAEVSRAELEGAHARLGEILRGERGMPLETARWLVEVMQLHPNRGGW